MKKIIVACPSQDTMMADTAFSLANMCMWSTWRCHQHHRIMANISQKGSCIEAQRNRIAFDALRMGSTHVFMFDSDMEFPPYTLERLLAHGKPIVGIDASTRREPIRRLAYQEDGSWMVGGGILLIETEVFRKLAMPWFDNPYELINGVLQKKGEDYFFCRKAREAGIPVHCDMEISKEIKHIGTKAYGIE